VSQIISVTLRSFPINRISRYVESWFQFNKIYNIKNEIFHL